MLVPRWSCLTQINVASCITVVLVVVVVLVVAVVSFEQVQPQVSFGHVRIESLRLQRQSSISADTSICPLGFVWPWGENPVPRLAKLRLPCTMDAPCKDKLPSEDVMLQLPWGVTRWLCLGMGMIYQS